MTTIEWTRGDDGSLGKTWNPVRGCSRVSEGCRNCYAEKIAARFSDVGKPFEGFATIGPRRGAASWTGKVALVPEKLSEPLHWRKPRRVFVNSMSDLFHEKLADEDIDKVFAVMALCPHLTFQVLTKRPERMMAYLGVQRPWADVAASLSREKGAVWSAVRRRCEEERELGCVDNSEAAWLEADSATDSGTRPLPNVWLGVSVEDQKTADERIPLLLEAPAALHFISAEPLLGPVDIRQWLAGGLDPTLPRAQIVARLGKCGLSWVIVGGESGPKARPFDVAWARAVVDQCRAAGVLVFMKQMGARPYELAGDHLGADGSVPVGCFSGFRDRAGADPSEWPESLRVREFPEVRS